jgi:hypothetical protein
MKEDSKTISKYGRADTQSKLSKQWEKSQDDIKMAKSGEACERLIELYSDFKRIALKERSKDY